MCFGISSYAGNIEPPYIEPPIIAPAATTFNWSGPYAGLSAGVTHTKEQRPYYARRDITETPHRPMTKADLVQDVVVNGCDGYPDVLTFTKPGMTTYTMTCSSLANLTDHTGGHNIFVEGQEVAGTPEIIGSEVFQIGTETVRETYATYGAFAGYRYQFQSGLVLGGEIAGNHYDSKTRLSTQAQAGYVFGRALPYVSAGWDLTEESATVGGGLDYALSDRWVVGTSYNYIERIDAHRINARFGIKF